MGFVIGAIKILSIPACWEGNGRSDSTTTLLLWQTSGIITRAGRSTKRILLNIGFAAMAELLLHSFACAEHRIADDHAEARLEGSSLRSPIVR